MTPADDGEDMVARRIVMRSSTWADLVHLADALRETRQIECSASEIAVVVLEVGLVQVKNGDKKRSSAKKMARKASVPL